MGSREKPTTQKMRWLMGSREKPTTQKMRWLMGSREKPTTGVSWAVEDGK